MCSNTSLLFGVRKARIRQLFNLILVHYETFHQNLDQNCTG